MATPVDSVSLLMQRLKTTMLKVLNAPSTLADSMAVIPQMVQRFITGPQKVLLWVTEAQQQSNIRQKLKQLACQLWERKERTLPLFIELDQLAHPLTHLLMESIQHYGLTESEAQELIATSIPITLILLHYEKLKFKKPKNLYLINQLERYPIKKMIITCEASYLVPLQGNYALNFMSYRERQAEGKLFMELKCPTLTVKLKQEEVVHEDYWGKLLAEDLATLLPHGIPSLEDFKQHPLNQRRIVDNPGELMGRANSIRNASSVDKKGKAFQFKKMAFLFLRFSKQYEEVTVGAANAITILNFAKVSFSGMDLSYIRVPYADLTGSNFDQSICYKANFSHVVLHRSWIRLANFNEANLYKAKLGDMLLKHQEVKHYLTVVQFSETGNFLATGCFDGMVYIWDMRLIKLVASIKGHKEGYPIRALSFSTDKKLLASGGDDARIVIYDTNQKRLLKKLPTHSEIIYHVLFSADNKKVIAATLDNIIWIWDFPTGDLLAAYDGEFGIKSLSLLPEQLLVVGLKKVKIWDISRGRAYLVDSHCKTKVALIKRTTHSMYFDDGSGIWDISSITPSDIITDLPLI